MLELNLVIIKFNGRNRFTKKVQKAILLKYIAYHIGDCFSFMLLLLLLQKLCDYANFKYLNMMEMKWRQCVFSWINEFYAVVFVSFSCNWVINTEANAPIKSKDFQWEKKLTTWFKFKVFFNITVATDDNVTIYSTEIHIKLLKMK